MVQPVELPAKPPSLLPYGDTLHYFGCGCPLGWVPGTRSCDLVDGYVQQAFFKVQQGLLAPLRPLRVLFVLPHHNITGGMKMLVEQIRLLRQRGHFVVALTRSDTAQRAMPPWTSLEADLDVVCRLGQRVDEVCDTVGLDAVVVGIFHQVAEWLLTSPAPVLYWEQGHEWLFGDPVRLQEVHNYRAQDQLFHQAMHLPCALAAVSEAVQRILAQEFGRGSLVIQNGIDCQRFVPGARCAAEPTKRLTAADYVATESGEEARPSVLLVGNPSLALKGFDVAISALSLVNRVHPIQVTWVCQSEPSEDRTPSLLSCGLQIDLHVSPSQELLPALYRGHDCFLFSSHYEAWGMPVLEAMASGLAVVTTDCLGVASFARAGVNCLMAAPQDVVGLAKGVLAVLGQPALKQRLQAAARQTAELFSPDSVASQLEAVLYSLTLCSQELLQLRHASAMDIQVTSLWAVHACSRHSQSQAQQEQQALEQQPQVQERSEEEEQQDRALQPQQQQQSGQDEEQPSAPTQPSPQQQSGQEEEQPSAPTQPSPQQSGQEEEQPSAPTQPQQQQVGQEEEQPSTPMQRQQLGAQQGGALRSKRCLEMGKEADDASNGLQQRVTGGCIAGGVQVGEH